ncbi:mitochondrial ornithine carrier protein, variant 2 [Balamuthia mandrillaris]
MGTPCCGWSEGPLTTTTATAADLQQPLERNLHDYRRHAQNLFVGSFAGMAGVCAGHPFDTVKVRLQAQYGTQRLLYAGLGECVRSTWRAEGLVGFYKGSQKEENERREKKRKAEKQRKVGREDYEVARRSNDGRANLGHPLSGMLTPMLGSSVVASVLFGSFSITTRAVSGFDDVNLLSLPQIFLAGGLCSFFVSNFNTPIDLVKSRLQIQRRFAASSSTRGGVWYNGPWHCVKHTLKTEGVAGLWRGWTATVLRDCFSLSMYLERSAKETIPFSAT